MNKGNKKVSIILPVYNAERFLRKCIESILGQSYELWELIAIDDGSKDGSLNILKSYDEKDKRIIVVSKQNEGVAIARNVALEHATGEFVYFVDADDVVMPNALQMLVSEIENKQATFVKCDFIPIDEDGKQVFVNKKQFLRRKYDGKVLDAEKFFPKILMNEFFLWTCLFRKEIIDTYHIRFIPHCRLMEDAAFIADYLLHSNENIYKDACVYCYRKYSGAATAVGKDYSTDLLLINEHASSYQNRRIKKLLLCEIHRGFMSMKGNCMEKTWVSFLRYWNRFIISIRYKLNQL